MNLSLKIVMVWVKFREQIFDVDVSGCELVHHLKEKIKSETLDANEIELWMSDGTELFDGTEIQDLGSISGFAPNSPVSPLVAKTVIFCKRYKRFWANKGQAVRKHYDERIFKFRLDQFDLSDSGLCGDRAILFCREEFHNLFKFLQTSVIEGSSLAWILGSPGTGKSTTVFAFMTTLDSSEWIVTWIHLFKSGLPLCVRFNNFHKWAAVIDPYENLGELLFSVEDLGKKHIICLDGFSNTARCTEYSDRCITWVSKHRELRRLVVVSSLGSRGRSSLEEDFMRKVSVKYVSPWSMDDYGLAIGDPEFFDVVKDNLDAVPHLEGVTVSKEEKLASKYYFAGGSARMMFGFRTALVCEALIEASMSVTDVIAYLRGTVGVLSNAVVNRLLTLHWKSGVPKACIVSRFAASELATRAGPDMLLELVRSLDPIVSAPVKGWFYEMWFFANIKVRPVRLRGSAQNTIELPQCPVVVFDPDNIDWSAMHGHKLMCLKPMKWSQGGYDAVLLDTENQHTIFLQITRAEKHSLKLQYFHSLMKNLSTKLLTLKLRIIFVVHKDNLKKFRIPDSTVEGQGLLAAFRDGWEVKGGESKKVEIFAAEDFEDGW